VVTRVRNGYADFGESLKNLAKVLLLSPNIALFGHFCHQVIWRKYFRPVTSHQLGETFGESGGKSASKTSLIIERFDRHFRPHFRPHFCLPFGS